MRLTRRFGHHSSSSARQSEGLIPLSSSRSRRSIRRPLWLAILSVFVVDLGRFRRQGLGKVLGPAHRGCGAGQIRFSQSFARHNSSVQVRLGSENCTEQASFRNRHYANSLHGAEIAPATRVSFPSRKQTRDFASPKASALCHRTKALARQPVEAGPTGWRGWCPVT
jgi:hypothetical protein